MRDGSALPARYALVEADQLLTSHDPHNFLPRREYPEGVQGRDYQRNRGAQGTVARHAAELNPDLALNPSESIAEGPPTITPDGTVLAGNERTMLLDRASVLHPERYEAYRTTLAARAEQFGVDGTAVARMKRPALVRVLTDARDIEGGPARWSEINRMSDEAAGKAKSAQEEGASRAAKLSQAPESLKHLAETMPPESTMLEYLGTAPGRTLVRTMMREGIITPEEYGRLADASGALTEDGRQAVRRMVLSAAVDDPVVLLDAPPEVVKRLEHAAPAIARNVAGPWDIRPQVTRGLRLLAEARGKGLSWAEFVGQQSLFGAEDRGALPMAELLQQPQARVKEAFRRYAQFAHEGQAAGGAADMFGTAALTPETAFEQVFGFPKTDGPLVPRERETRLTTAITADEMQQRRDALGLPKDPANAERGAAGPDQGEMFPEEIRAVPPKPAGDPHQGSLFERPRDPRDPAQLALFHQRQDAHQRAYRESLQKAAGVADPEERRTLLAAAKELARTGRVSILGMKMPKTEEALALLLRPWRDPYYEHLHFVAYRKGKIVGHRVDTSYARNYVMPSGMRAEEPHNRRFFYQLGRWAKRLGADAIDLAHNHPSGDPTPSRDDAAFTRYVGGTLQEYAAVPVRHHVVIDHGHYGVVGDGGSIPWRVEPLARDARTGVDWEARASETLTPQRTAQYVAGLEHADDKWVVVHMDARTRPVGVVMHTADWTEEGLSKFKRRVAQDRAAMASHTVLVQLDRAAPDVRPGPSASYRMREAMRNDDFLVAVVADQAAPAYYAEPPERLTPAHRIRESAPREEAPPRPSPHPDAIRALPPHVAGAALGAATGAATGGEDDDALERAFYGALIGFAAGRGVRAARGGMLAAQTARAADDLRRAFAPASRSAEARAVEGAIRHHTASARRATAAAYEALKTHAAAFAPMPEAERLAFLHNMEAGRPQATPALTAAARSLRVLLDSTRDEVRALGTGKLARYIENYVPHLWKDAKGAERVIRTILARRPLHGSKGFLQQRTISTIMEGMERGHELVTTNPIELTMLRVQDMRRYIAGEKIVQELKAKKLAKYIPVEHNGPAGWVKVNDPIGSVWTKPIAVLWEGFDARLRQQLDAVMQGLGVQHARKAVLSPGMHGYAEPGRVVTRFGGAEGTIQHELGHVLDFKFKLWDRLVASAKKKDRGAIQREMRALADLRFEGVPAEQLSDHYRKYVRQREEKIANAFDAYLYVPDRMREVAPTVYERMREFVETTPEMAEVRKIKPSLVRGSAKKAVDLGGLLLKGHYWVPEPVGLVINRHLSPGLTGRVAVFDAFRGLGNVLNQAQLGLSLFHAGFTTADVMVSKAALGVMRLARGDMRGLGDIARSPIAPWENFIRGSKMLREYLTPGSEGAEFAALVDALEKGGGAAFMDSFYHVNAIRQFQDAIAAGRQGKAAALSLPALLEKVAAPVMQDLVPRQKLGVFADLARDVMERMPTASEAEIREALGKAWDSVDNRLGQLVYDNLFWHRTFKDLMMVSVRSVGWNLGTVRELGGGAMDLAAALRSGNREIGPRAAYVAALTLVVGGLGAAVQYLYTGGTPPETWRDYYYPRTGRVNPDGTDERIQLPTYLKDVFAYGTAPLTTVKHKLHPLAGLVADMLSNEDFYGNEIRNPDDPLVQQMQQQAEYLAKAFIPFGVRNAIEGGEAGQPAKTRALNFVGITPAPRAITRSPAVTRMYERLGRRGHFSLTPEEAEESDLKRQLRQQLEREGTAALPALRQAVKDGALSVKDAERLWKRAQGDPLAERFKQLPLLDALEVFQMGSEEERGRWREVLDGKLGRAREDDYTPAEWREVQRRLKKLRGVAIGAPAEREGARLGLTGRPLSDAAHALVGSPTYAAIPGGALDLVRRDPRFAGQDPRRLARELRRGLLEQAATAV